MRIKRIVMGFIVASMTFTFGAWTEQTIYD